MTERPLKKLTRIINEADKLVQTVQKSVGKMLADINELKQAWPKSEDKRNE